MSQWDDIRQQARAQRTAVLGENSGVAPAEALLAAADRLTGFGRIPLRAGDPLLDGGDAALDHEMRMIWFNRDVSPRLALFYQAHEYAHLSDAEAKARAGYTPTTPTTPSLTLILRLSRNHCLLA